jgi:hypothetical protein
LTTATGDGRGRRRRRSRAWRRAAASFNGRWRNAAPRAPAVSTRVATPPTVLPPVDFCPRRGGGGEGSCRRRRSGIATMIAPTGPVMAATTPAAPFLVAVRSQVAGGRGKRRRSRSRSTPLVALPGRRTRATTHTAPPPVADRRPSGGDGGGRRRGRARSTAAATPPEAPIRAAASLVPRRTRRSTSPCGLPASAARAARHSRSTTLRTRPGRKTMASMPILPARSVVRRPSTIDIGHRRRSPSRTAAFLAPSGPRPTSAITGASSPVAVPTLPARSVARRQCRRSHCDARAEAADAAADRWRDQCGWRRHPQQCRQSHCDDRAEAADATADRRRKGPLHPQTRAAGRAAGTGRVARRRAGRPRGAGPGPGPQRREVAGDDDDGGRLQSQLRRLLRTLSRSELQKVATEVGSGWTWTTRAAGRGRTSSP